MNKNRSGLFNTLTMMSVGAVMGSIANMLPLPQVLLLALSLGALVGIISARINKLEMKMKEQDDTHNDTK